MLSFPAVSHAHVLEAALTQNRTSDTRLTVRPHSLRSATWPAAPPAWCSNCSIDTQTGAVMQTTTSTVINWSKTHTIASHHRVHQDKRARDPQRHHARLNTTNQSRTRPRHHRNQTRTACARDAAQTRAAGRRRCVRRSRAEPTRQPSRHAAIHRRIYSSLDDKVESREHHALTGTTRPAPHCTSDATLQHDLTRRG